MTETRETSNILRWTQIIHGPCSIFSCELTLEFMKIYNGRGSEDQGGEKCEHLAEGGRNSALGHTVSYAISGHLVLYNLVKLSPIGNIVSWDIYI